MQGGVAEAAERMQNVGQALQAHAPGTRLALGPCGDDLLNISQRAIHLSKTQTTAHKSG